MSNATFQFPLGIVFKNDSNLLLCYTVFISRIFNKIIFFCLVAMSAFTRNYKNYFNK